MYVCQSGCAESDSHHVLTRRANSCLSSLPGPSSVPVAEPPATPWPGGATPSARVSRLSPRAMSAQLLEDGIRDVVELLGAPVAFLGIGVERHARAVLRGPPPALGLVDRRDRGHRHPRARPLLLFRHVSPLM